MKAEYARYHIAQAKNYIDELIYEHGFNDSVNSFKCSLDSLNEAFEQINYAMEVYIKGLSNEKINEE